ncbi:MAG: hypothetical protein HY343_12870 [Lentisphaerae bacterium]|nr:hypothetical protein [Lentisphaerota bacterium]
MRALRGEPVDRPPIWTHIPFGLAATGFLPAPFHGYADGDRWREQDPAYGRLVRRMETDCDNCFIWRPPCMRSEPYLCPLSLTRETAARNEEGHMLTVTTVTAAGRQWRQVSATQPGVGHSWTLEHFCKEPRDAEALLELPWEGDPPEAGDFFELQARLGTRGTMWPTVPSPLLVVCRLFEPTEFLILARTHTGLVHRLLERVAERIGRNIAALLKAGIGPLFRFGGAEHATPPLMAPSDFDEFVVRYDTPLVRLVKQGGGLVGVHCHGHLRHALRRFAEMGVDVTDPVEAVPDGDVTLDDARLIAGGRVTLAGNIQMRELAAASPADIRQRVKGIVREAGPARLIVTATGTPLGPITAPEEANYNAMIDAARE